jgi:hypothetical protein
MTVYKLGSKGEEVTKIQEELNSLGFYKGPIDGDFGGGTEAGVRAFQKTKRLDVDGKVGPKTWKVLFGSKIPKPSFHSKGLDHRCLALTGTFETGSAPPDCFCGLSGDFDGQGISFGVLQWNLGQESLQPLLRDMIERHTQIVRDIFESHFDILVEALDSNKTSQEELMGFARAIQHPATHTLFEPWRGMARELGRTEEFQEIEVENSTRLFNSAKSKCQEYGLWSERAVALMFDISVQNGGISNLVKTVILKDFSTLPQDLAPEESEVRKMVIVANRRAEAANPRWIDDVRSRKLCIAKGEGVVHGISFNLDEQFGIGLKRF